jgi:hypothetical protein
MKMKWFICFFLSVLTLPLLSQRNNYVIQTAPSSFGGYVSGGVNVHSQGNYKGKSAIGYQAGFGLSFFKHKANSSFELGLSYGNQWMHYKNENVLDSMEGSYGLRFKYIGIPLSYTYKLSQNKSRGFLMAGIEPSMVLAPSLYEFETSKEDIESNTYFPQTSNKKPLNFQIYGGLGRSYDVSRDFMLRIELRYQLNNISVFDNQFTAHSAMLRFLFLNHN